MRRKYLLNGPCQPRTLDFLGSWIGANCRRFNPEWFDEFGNWLEYGESTDKAYCFTCFLFRDPTKKRAGYMSFVVDGWNCWNNKDRLKEFGQIRHGLQTKIHQRQVHENRNTKIQSS